MLTAFAFKSVRFFQGRCNIFNYLAAGWFAGARNCIAILTVVFNNGVMATERDVLKLSTLRSVTTPRATTDAPNSAAKAAISLASLVRGQAAQQPQQIKSRAQIST
jgi:hypothetical protein